VPIASRGFDLADGFGQLESILPNFFFFKFFSNVLVQRFLGSCPQGPQLHAPLYVPPFLLSGILVFDILQFHTQNTLRYTESIAQQRAPMYTRTDTRHPIRVLGTALDSRQTRSHAGGPHK